MAAACTACGAAETTEVIVVEGYQQGTWFPIRECSACGSQFAPDASVPEEIYDTIYERGRVLPGYHRYWGYAQAVEHLRWPLHYLACSEEMYWGVEQVVHQRGRRARTRVLEVGSGLGYLTAALRRSGCDATGVDLSVRAVEDARERFGPHYEVRDALEVQAADDPYDLVVALELIEHLPDPLAFLAPLVASLPPGGAVIVSTPDKSHHPKGAIWQTELPPVHLHWFTEEGFEALVARAGGRVEFLDLAPFIRIAVPSAAAPTGSPTVPPAPILGEDLQPLRTSPPAPRPSLRDRLLRYPFTGPLAVAARRIRQRRSGGSVIDRKPNSFVAVIRRAGA